MSERIGRYRLVRTLGSGGMAHLYEAVAEGEHGFERRVAIKRILPELLGDEAAHRMFLDEARIAARLHHGGIVQVLDFGMVDGQPFMVMEFVDGIDAARAERLGRARGRPIPVGVVLHVGAEVAAALRHAHELRGERGEPRPVVHRDVSPHNVLLSWGGDVKLTDFGIAKAAGRQERTATGLVKGKPGYMAPEQAAADEVGPPADIYALGASLHGLLLGEPPPLGAPPSEDLEDEAVRALLADLLAFEPEARPTAAQAAERLARLASDRLGGRGGRAALVDWLAPLREGARPASVLDDVMGLVLVCEDAGARRFTARRTASGAASSRGAAGSALSVDGPERGGDVPRASAAGGEPEAAGWAGRTAATVRLPMRRGAGVVLLGVASVLLGALGWRWLFAAPASERPAVVAAAVSDGGVARSEGGAARAGGGFRDASGGERRDAAVPGADRRGGPGGVQGTPGVSEERREPDGPRSREEAGRSPASRRRVGRSGRRGARGASRSAGSAGAAGVPAATPTSTPRASEAGEGADGPKPVSSGPSFGYVRIGRRGAGQERVLVDGRPAGFTPLLLRLATGSHHVRIEAVEDGRVRHEGTVQVGAGHTRRNPAVLR